MMFVDIAEPLDSCLKEWARRCLPQLTDTGSPTVGNTTNGSWWIVKFNLLAELIIQSNTTNGSWWKFHLPPKTKAGFEQSTNCRWWDLLGVGGLLCRLELNYPPTAVGGIRTLPQKR
jgi:hypothetical protein